MAGQWVVERGPSKTYQVLRLLPGGRWEYFKSAGTKRPALFRIYTNAVKRANDLNAKEQRS